MVRLALALGLGDITLHSALNQPLRADIALVDAAGLEEASCRSAWPRRTSSAVLASIGCSSSTT
jgi:Tfp pilus assembly protein FimV